MSKRIATFIAFATLLIAPAGATQDYPIWGELEGATPAELGNRLLVGLDHGEIIDIRYPSDPMGIPEERDLLIYELPRPIGAQGCQRIVWEVTVGVEPFGSDVHRDLILARRESRSEVALRREAPCLFARYVQLHEMSAEEGIAGLQALARFSPGERPYHCTDDRPASICRDEQAIATFLSRYLPYRIFQRRDGWLFWSNGETVWLPHNPALPAHISRGRPVPF